MESIRELFVLLFILLSLVVIVLLILKYGKISHQKEVRALSIVLYPVSLSHTFLLSIVLLRLMHWLWGRKFISDDFVTLYGSGVIFNVQATLLHWSSLGFSIEPREAYTLKFQLKRELWQWTENWLIVHRYNWKILPKDEAKFKHEALTIARSMIFCSFIIISIDFCIILIQHPRILFHTLRYWWRKMRNRRSL